MPEMCISNLNVMYIKSSAIAFTRRSLKKAMKYFRKVQTCINKLFSALKIFALKYSAVSEKKVFHLLYVLYDLSFKKKLPQTHIHTCVHV